MCKDTLYAALCAAHDHDEQSICTIVDKFKPLLKKYAYHLNYDCAETDLIIFLLELISKVEWRSLFNLSESALVNYIVHALRNKKNDLFRKSKRSLQEVHLMEEHLCQKDSDIINVIFIKELLKQLTDKQQEVIIYKFLFGLSDLEIGIKMKISRQAVNQIKNRSLITLKELVMKY